MDFTPAQEAKFKALYDAEQEKKFQQKYDEEQAAKLNAYPEAPEYSDKMTVTLEGPRFDPNPDYYTKSIPNDVKMKAGFVPEQARAEYYKKYMESVKPGSSSRMRIKNGKTQVLDDDNVWRAVGGAAESVGQAPSTVLEMVGGVGGAIGGTALGSMVGGPLAPATAGTGAIAGGAGGSALGAYAGRKIEHSISTQIDPQNALTKEEANQLAAEDARTSALWSAAGDLLFGGLRAARGWVRGWGPSITPSEARLLADNDQVYLQAARSVGSKYRLDQATNFGKDDASRAFQSKIANVLQNPEVQSREYWRQRDSYDAVEAYLSPGQATPGYKDTAGEQFNIALGLEKQDTVGAAARAVGNAERAAARAVAAIPGAGEQMPTLTAAGQQIRALREQEKSKVDAAYASYREAIGQKEGTYASDYQLPISRGILTEQKILDKLAANAVIDSQKTGRNIFALDLKELKKKGGSIDLAMVDDAIQRMSKAISKAQSGVSTLPVEVGDLIRVRNKFKDWRSKALKDLPPEVRDAHDMAEAQYKEYASKYKHGMISQLLVKDEAGKFKLSDPQAIVRMFQANDKVAIEQLLNISKGSPELQSQLRKLAFAHYRDHVVDKTVDGEAINLAKEAQYMRGPLGGGFWENLKPLFSPGDQVLLTKAGGLGRAVLNAEKKLQETRKAWSLAAGGKLEQMAEMTPGGLVSRIFSDSTKAWEPHQILYAVRTVEKHAKLGNISAGAVDEFREGVRTAIIDRIKTSDGELSLPKLQSLLKNNGTRIKAALGKDYTDSLETVARLLGKERASALPPGDPKILEGLRAAAFGPMSHGGLTARVTGTWRKYNNQVRLYEALTDPAKMKEAETFYQRAAFGYGAASGFSLLSEEYISD